MKNKYALCVSLILYSCGQLFSYQYTSPLLFLRNVEEKVAEAPNFDDEEFTQDIVTALAELYQKVIETSVTYYLIDINSEDNKESLYVKVTKVIVFDLLKIVGLLFAKLIKMLQNPDLSWRQKIQQCWWVVGMIVMIKIGVEKMAYNNTKDSKSPS